MAAKIKVQSVAIAKAVAAILEQQKKKHWDGEAHLHMIGHLAMDCGLPPEKRLAFVKAMADAESEMAYASNFKKWLIALGEIESDEEKESEYK